MENEMEYQGGHNSLERDLQGISDDCFAAMNGDLLESGYLPIGLPASPDPLIGTVPDVQLQVNYPLNGDQAERGVKRKSCSSNSSSLTPSGERRLIAEFNLRNPARLQDLGPLTDGDFGNPNRSQLVETVIPQPGSSCMSSWTQSPVLFSPVSYSGSEHCVSPPTAGVISDSATRTSPITVPPSSTNSSDKGMPSASKMELNIGYMNNRRGIFNIEKEDGFLLFHEKTPDPTKLPKDIAFIRCPDPDGSEHGSGSQSKLDEKQAKYVRTILDNMWGGLQVRSDNGCIYATRWSKAKIFYRSYETRHSQDRDSMSDVVELSRGKEQLVFNLSTFKKRILEEYMKHDSEVQAMPQSEQSKRHKDLVQKINPTIYFTFAQKWAPDSHPLNTCLVWAQLKPCQALYNCDGLFHAKHNSLDDYNSEMLQISMGSLGIDTHRGS